MFTKRFFISWISTSATMFFLSYVWHGIFLTDYSRLSYPKEVFLIFAAFAYLVVGFVVSKAIDTKTFSTHLKRQPVLRGLVSGAVCGLAFFLIATVIGVSFSTAMNVENLLLDVSWQMIEQAIGGMVVGTIHIFVYDPSAHYED